MHLNSAQPLQTIGKSIILLQFVVGTATSSCQSLSKIDFNDCGSNDGYNRRLLQRNMSNVLTNTTLNTPQVKCQYTETCRQIFKVARLSRLSFSTTISIQLANMLQSCCGNCTKFSETRLDPPLENVNRTVLDSFDIIYPVYAQSSLTEMHGFHFISVLNIPGAYYFTLKVSARAKVSNMAKAVLELWPLLAISLLLCAIAGFLIWLFDTWTNRSEFPRSFFTGTREGFWWSFVSMTTVGYGDKIPKSQAARAFAVAWILAGITIHSIFTAKLTSDVTAVQSVEDPPLDDQTVGVLENRMYDLVMVSQHRGIIKQFPFNDTIFGLASLIENLASGDIDGFLVSIPTYLYFSGNMKNPKKEKYREPLERVRSIQMDRWEKDFRGERLVAGMLVQNTTDYNYYRKFIESYWLQVQVCYSRDLTYKHKKLDKHPDSPMEGIFVFFCYAALWVLLGMVCFGALFEFVRWKRWIPCDKQKDKAEDYDDVEGNQRTYVWNKDRKSEEKENEDFTVSL